MIRPFFIVAVLAAMAAPAAAQPAAPAHNRVQLLAEHSSLDRGLGSWSEVGVQLSRHWSVRQVAELGLVRTRRFGLDDDQLQAGYSTPLTPALTASLQASLSPTHRVLPKHALGGQLQYEFAPGWLAHGGLRHTRYDTAEVDLLRLGLERYVGDFSFSGTWTGGRSLGQDLQGLELRAAWYYAEESSVGLIAVRGDEATQLGAGRVVLADVRGGAVVGRHRMAPGQWLVWSLQRTRQGDFYTRTGATLGFQLAF